MEMGRRDGEDRWRGEGGCERMREGERREREGGRGGTRRITDNTFDSSSFPLLSRPLIQLIKLCVC